MLVNRIMQQRIRTWIIMQVTAKNWCARDSVKEKRRVSVGPIGHQAACSWEQKCCGC